MAETERITVAEISENASRGQTGTDVSLPVVELLTGRGFVTGKSGSGKSNSASVIAEKLLDNGFGLLIVDIDGEYYGLKEEYEILHVGADEECDIQVTTDHSEKLASLALEGNVPIILDVSSYIDESEAEEVLTDVSKSLFAKAKKEKQPFLMLVEEVHEYIPENGSVGECGKMLIKISKRGRKHGLGICGISQRPADVKKDFITQCDWLLWHRLTWKNDTKVVRRVLDGEYASAVEDLDDGEGFMMTDWAGSIQRVQFFRKRTFDAGATPGLDDFERPELKSVSDNLVSELEEISEEKQATEDRIAQLREELDRKNSRIAELEKELQDARDMSRMADQFVDALVRHVEGPAPGRTERERMGASPAQEPTRTERTDREDDETDSTEDEPAGEPGSTDDTAFDPAAFGEVMETDGEESGDEPESTATEEQEEFLEESVAGRSGTDGAVADGGAGAATGSTDEFSADAILEALDVAAELPAEEVLEQGRPSRAQTPREEIEASIRADAEFIDEDRSDGSHGEDEPLVVRELKADIGGLETRTRKMLAFYRDQGPGTPLNAHFAAGGDGSRTDAYAHNRTLRTMGVIEHVGRGHYDYCLRECLAADLDADDETIDAHARLIENTVFE